MKAIMIMYDSLKLNMLEPYGCDWVKTPNFTRLAEKTVCFEKNYVGSMPCMPARRELHTGRYNFLHRSWGPLEPFDDSMPEILKLNDVHTHIVTDHQHYWEDGGATYHNRYSTYEFVRGQEGDAWKADLGMDFCFENGFDINAPKIADPKMQKVFLSAKMNDQINRKYMDTLDKLPQTKTFKNGLEFLNTNHDKDNWFIQIETFDPHEPFFTTEEFKKLYPHDYKGLIADWPPYVPCTEDENTLQHVRFEYAALLTMCDFYLGKVLDFMDEHNMWDDTMLIVNTDHGFLLGEHNWWAKTNMPLYEEIAHTPLFIYDPVSKVQNERRAHLSQTIDIPVTLLNHFGVQVPKDMQGCDLRKIINDNVPVRDYAFYGYHSMHANITDGKHTYMKSPISYSKKPLYEYTLMPCHMKNMFNIKELQNIELTDEFSFTKGCKVMKIEAITSSVAANACNYGTKLYDIESDPHEMNEIEDYSAEQKMLKLLIRAMKENESPKEQFERLGITSDASEVNEQYIIELHERERAAQTPCVLTHCTWNKEAKNMYNVLTCIIPPDMQGEFLKGLEEFANNIKAKTITKDIIFSYSKKAVPQQLQEMAFYFLNISARTQ